GRPDVGSCADTDRSRDAIVAGTRSARRRCGPNTAEPDASASFGNGQPAASPNAERAMKTFLSCRAKSRHPDALSRVRLRESSTSLGMPALLIFGLAGPIFGLTPGDLSRVTLEEHPGLQLSHDLVFRDETGQHFRFGNSAAKQPTVIVPGYYRCPMLCPLINDGLIQTLQESRMSVGSDIQVIDFSIDLA